MFEALAIPNSENWCVDYDKSTKRYRVSYFEDNHFQDEIYFDAYEEKEISKEEK